MNQTPENIHEYFKYVTDKDQAWTAIGLTEKSRGISRCCL